MKKYCVYFALLLFSSLVMGQEKPYYFKNYQTNDGLSSNTINAVLQDKKGFMWFGSRNGLNRFDGSRFKVFRNSLADTNSIGSNSIISLFEDRKEKLWIGTTNGIYIYDPVTERFHSEEKLPKGEIQRIGEDSFHNMWILSTGKLYKYAQATRKVTVYDFSNNWIDAFHLAANGTLWLIHSNDVIRKLNVKEGTSVTYTIPRTTAKISDLQQVFPIDGHTLLLAAKTNFVVYDVKKNKIKIIPHKKSDDIHTNVITRYAEDEFWLGTEKGLYIYDAKHDRISIKEKQIGDPYMINDNVVSDIYKDKEGGVWLATYFGGINYYSNQYNFFRKYFPKQGANTLSGNIIHEIVKDDFNQLWVGTEDAGLNQVDLASGHITKYLPGNSEGDISYTNIHGLCADGNELWIGTYDHGLDVMDLKTHKIIRHYSEGNDSKSFHNNFIISVYKDRDGQILVGTWSGLFRYDRKQDNFSEIPFFQRQVQSIYQSEDGTLWVGSYGSGVSFQNARTAKQGRLRHIANKANSIISDYVNSIYEDSNHEFWFCTERGLSHYKPRQNTFVNYTSENGLPSDQIFRIVQGDADMFWISTGSGLVSFNSKNHEFTSFHRANGLPTEQFNYNSSFADKDGTIYFGTLQGMISFEPSKFIRNKFIPPVYITGFQVNNIDLPITKKSPLQQSVLYTQSISLPHDKTNLNLDIAALSYVNPQMNQYQYMLEGIDKAWILLKTNRKIYYSNLQPGNYTFKARGSNGEGLWNRHETMLRIEIRPPWWGTWWAYVLYSLVLAGIAITIFRYYHMAITEKNKRKIEAIEINTEREIFNAKIEFFTNITHEIRTPLTLIKMPLDKLFENTALPGPIIASLEMIKKNTNRLIDLTNQLLDFRKAEANKFSLNFTESRIQEVLQEIYSDFRFTAEHKGLEYTLEMPRQPLYAFIDTDAVKKIISNLLSNAIKYAEHTVFIKLHPFSSEDTAFHIEVRNDGYIIPAKYYDKIFEPFFRIKQTDKEEGSGIGLSLSRSLALLHQGDLVIQTDERLNIFLLTLLIQQESSMHLMESAVDKKEEQREEGQLAPDKDGPIILLVEDNKEILHYVHHELSNSFQVLKATNGKQALEILEAANIQLVISDIMMPIMDGIELCKRMKTDLQYSHVPIILLTAKSSLSSKIEGLEVGADAYIAKPFSLEHLMAQINSLLNNRALVKEYFANSPLTHLRGIACSKADKNFLENLNNIIAERITELDLDVSTLSKMMNMSKPTFYRKIKSLSDMTPNELINLTRLKKAAELLAQGDYKINEVALMVGYNSPSNFSRDFQRQFNVSPSSYISNLKV